MFESHYRDVPVVLKYPSAWPVLHCSEPVNALRSLHRVPRPLPYGDRCVILRDTTLQLHTEGMRMCFPLKLNHRNRQTGNVASGTDDVSARIHVFAHGNTDVGD